MTNNTKHSVSINKIALLATGNEITEGDILNTNGQAIANELTAQGFVIGFHIVVSDSEDDITTALQFLLQTHDAIIMIGGLGPTSDDRTRYALSRVIQKKLILDEKTWGDIVERYQKMQLPLHENNKQQALFPEDAIILPNLHGSAAGSRVEFNNKFIYMLPGPPIECLPMFNHYVLPELLAHAQAKHLKKLTWRLIGVIESDIAAKVDEATQGFPVTTGYRVDYPYTHIKIYSEDNIDLNPLLKKLNAIFAPHIIDHSNLSATELLQQLITTQKKKIIIEDSATGGRLQRQLLTQDTFPNVQFNSPSLDSTNHPQQIQVKITGLKEYWEKHSPPCNTSITIQVQSDKETLSDKVTIPYRNQYVLRYATEYAALALWKILRRIFDSH